MRRTWMEWIVSGSLMFCLAAFAPVDVNAQAGSATQVAHTGSSRSPLNGEWKGETFAAGGVAGVTLNLYSNGTYARRIVVVSEYGWTLEGNALMLAALLARTDTGSTYGRAAIVRVQLIGDSLVARAGRDAVHLKRVTSLVEASPLLGRWEGLSDLNESVTQDFTADGRLIVSLTVSREAGRFSHDGEWINWAEQIPVPKNKKTRYRLEDGRLSVYFEPRLPPLELERVVADPAQ